jgi:16S rRNA processing protein RimM
MGRISAAYGVRGMVKVQSLAADPDSLVAQSTWYTRPREGGEWRQRRVRDARAHGGALVATLEGIETREQAAALRGAEVGVARAALPPLAADEVYWADLEGMAVVNRDGVALGTVAGVTDNGAHAILRVVDSDMRERLIPWVPQYVEAFDRDAARIDVDWPLDY